MGGYGSGRPAQRGVIEHRTRLDIRQFVRRGWLRCWGSGSLSWSRGGETTTSLEYRVFADSVELDYVVTSYEQQRMPVCVTIPIRRIPCRFGGERLYWGCPRCYRRCEVVVMAYHGQWWGCRKCMRLRYVSQGLAPGDRLQRRADELYARVGIESEDGSFIYKRKWMRWRTFNRLMDRANAASTAADGAFLYRLARLGFLSEADAFANVLGSESPQNG